MKKRLTAFLLIAAMMLSMSLLFTGCGPGEMPTFEMPEGGFDPNKEVRTLPYRVYNCGCLADGPCVQAIQGHLGQSGKRADRLRVGGACRT